LKSVTEESSRRLVLAQQKSDQSQFAADQLKSSQLQLDSNYLTGFGSNMSFQEREIITLLITFRLTS